MIHIVPIRPFVGGVVPVIEFESGSAMHFTTGASIDAKCQMPTAISLSNRIAARKRAHTALRAEPMSALVLPIAKRYCASHCVRCCYRR